MKFKKLFLSISLLSLCLLPINVSAAEEGTIRRLTPEEIAVLEKENLERAKAQSIQPYMDEIVENWVADGSKTSEWGPYKPCFNQNTEGHVLSQKGSGYYWADSSKTSGTWSASVGIAGKTINFSVGYQPGEKKTSGGVIEICPDNLIGKKTKLFCRRQYKVTRYAVYKKNKYESGKGTFSRYEYVPTKAASQTKVALYNAYK